jgi:putative sigma-54 modulation protein
MDVTEALKSYADQKASKLSKYYDLIQEIEVILDNSNGAPNVEMIVHAEHRNTFVAHHNDGDAYACIDGCSHKLERQITEHKKKFRNRKHPQDDSARNVHRN